jgi:hypothetical protein
MNKNPDQEAPLENEEHIIALQEKREFEEQRKAVLEVLKDFGERDYQWLWEYLGRHFRRINNMHKRDKNNYDKKIDQLVYIIQDEEISLSDILRLHKNEVLDLEYFKWINQKDYRQLIYIVNYIISNGQPERPEKKFYLDESLFKYILCYFDNRLHSRSKEAKLEKLEAFQNSWLEHATPDKYTKWLIVKEGEKWEWASEYLLKKGKQLDRFNSIHKGEHLNTLILASLDYMDWKTNFFENQIFIDKMKKAWSLQKFRMAEKAKNKYHLPLTKKTKQQLNELALLYNKKESEVLRILIQNAHTAEMLDDKGKNKYS